MASLISTSLTCITDFLPALASYGSSYGGLASLVFSSLVTSSLTFSYLVFSSVVSSTLIRGDLASLVSTRETADRG